MNMKNWKFAQIFSSGQEFEDFGYVEKMNEEIKKVGGLLHFSINMDESGWYAQCKEFEDIITGGSETNPSDKEIQKNIREAIHTAFHVSLIDSENKIPVNNAKQVRASYILENSTNLVNCAV